MSIHLIPLITGIILLVLTVVGTPDRNIQSKIMFKALPLLLGVSNITYALYQMGVFIVI